MKKITKKLKAMESVASLSCDSKTKTVVPKDGVFSPRALWEAMDEIGKSPLKLNGPSGEFTSKPEN